MDELLKYATAFGLASGAGAKATVPLLLVGAFHHTPYFELSQRFQWIASPAVMAVLAVLLVLELWADAHPELGWASDLAGYAPKFVAGFLAFAASSGKLDPSLSKLAATGLMGGATAAGVHFLRNRLRRPVREHAEQVHESVGKAVTFTEAGFSAGVSALAILLPLAALALVVIGGGTSWALSRRLSSPSARCPNGHPLHPLARVCPHCKALIA
jgi:hypothetical protein